MPLRHSRNSSSRHSILNDNSLLGATQSQPLLTSDNRKEQSWTSSWDSSLSGKQDDFVALCNLKDNEIENDGSEKDENDRVNEKLVIKYCLFNFLKISQLCFVASRYFFSL